VICAFVILQECYAGLRGRTVHGDDDIATLLSKLASARGI
jgi:hypothetical protein